MAEEYDFYEMGKRYTFDILSDLAKKSKEIEEKYGMDAKLQFESGIANSILYSQGYEDLPQEEIRKLV